METAKHSPGPWIIASGDTYEDNDGESLLQAICQQHGEQMTICHVFVTDCNYPELVKGVGEANLRLIAAAPDLLAACLMFTRIGVCHDWNKQFPELWQVAQEALAKAEGSSNNVH